MKTKKIFFPAGMLTALLLLSTAFTNVSALPIDTVKNTSFQPGEKVTYRIAYHYSSLWMSAGDATFKCEESTYNNKPVYHFTCYGSTYSSYDWFYKVRDKYESYTDETTALPIKFIRDVNEGGYIIYNNVTFDHVNKKATSTNGTYTIPLNTQDLISCIYWARNIDFTNKAVGDKIPFNLFIDDSTYALYVKYCGKEKITTTAGTFNCIKFKPLLINGNMFKGGEGMTVWVTDDLNHVPVRIESEIQVGAIAADAYKFEGLKNPMTAKVK